MATSLSSRSRHVMETKEFEDRGMMTLIVRKIVVGFEEHFMSLNGSVLIYPLYTRKLSYRKDDRAMRPVYGCSEIFGES